MAEEFDWLIPWRDVLKHPVGLLPNVKKEGQTEEALIVHCARLALWKEDRFQKSLQNLISTSSAKEKSDPKAEQHRLEGNKFFQQKLYHKALQHYTKAVLHASELKGTSQSSSQLSLALANRSAALFYLGKWQLATDDVDRALKHGYPSHQEYKILMRKGESLRNDGRYKDAAEALKAALESLARSALTPDDAKVKKERISKLLTSCTSDRVEEEEQVDETYLSDDKAAHFEKHPSIQNASSQVMLQYSSEKGRYLVAGRTINAGDVLISEKPFAVVLLRDHHDTHCHYCCSETLAPIGCSQCVQVQYCSEMCRDTAWINHHQVECFMWDIIQEVGSFGHLSLRISLNAGIHKSPTISSILQSLPTTADGVPGCRADGSYVADYGAVYSLETHICKQAVGDLFQASMIGLLLSLCVQMRVKGGDVIPWKTFEENEEIHMLAGLITRHILQLRCNVHAVTAVHPQGRGYDDDHRRVVDTTEQVRLASAAYPTTSLMNHGCNPNVIASFKGSEVTMRATRAIAEGEEICHCYGPHMNHMPVAERLRRLKEQYFFDCVCSACHMTSKEPADWSNFKCSECDGPATLLDSNLECTNQECLHKANATEKLKLKEKADILFQEAVKCCEKGNVQGCCMHVMTPRPPKESLQLLHESLNIHEMVLYKHHRTIAEVRDCLARCYALEGDFIRSAHHLEASITIVKEVYGNDSIEHALELQKFAQILFNGKQIKKAKTVISTALPLLSRFYGNQHDAVQELLEMQACLLSL